MILTAHQSVYLPWLGLLHKIAISDTYVYLDNVQFEKNSFTNRNKIKTAQKPVWLTVPVLLKNHFEKTIKEMEIDNSQDWSKKHWKSIYLNYKKAPYFKKYSDFLENVYTKEWRYLSDLNEYMLKYFLKELRIEVQYYKASELDLKERKSDLILEISEKLGANVYVSGALGKDYLKKEKFDRQGIKIYFQDYKESLYPQLYGEFLPCLSIIDLLFNCGDRSLEVLMKGNITKEELIHPVK